MKTNIWRIYESLRLDDSARQVACYDDGVGTSSFKPLALLGGAVFFAGVALLLLQNLDRRRRFVAIVGVLIVANVGPHSRPSGNGWGCRRCNDGRSVQHVARWRQTLRRGRMNPFAAARPGGPRPGP